MEGKNVPAVERVLLFVVDGLRPDALLQAQAPAMQDLLRRGAYSLNAQTIVPSITLPTHLSMFYSVPAEIHGVYGNTYHPMPDGPIPGITEVVRQAGRKPAFFHTWDPLRDLAQPGALNRSLFVNMYDLPAEEVDLRIAQIAAESIVQEPPDFAFVYLGMPDEIAHRHGWMSQPYFESIAWADAAFRHVQDALDRAGLMQGTACLLLADHGGHERSHGSDLPEDMTIPWALAGPGVRQGHLLQIPVSILDTAPTVARLLGLPIPAEWQGKVVEEALL